MARNLTTGLQRGLRRSIAGGLGASDLFSVAPLDLRFAQTKALDSRITFTRASSGTYVGSDGLIKTATTNEARFDHNPTTGESLGLLVEEQRTNLGIYSDVSQSSYIENITVTANNATSPDGTSNATRLTSTTTGTSNSNFADRSVAVSSNTVYTFSCYLKQGNTPLSSINLWYSGGTYREVRIAYTWSSKTIALTGTAGTGFTGSATEVGNGWVRLVVSLDSGNNTTAFARIHVRDNTTSGVTGDFVYAWGRQIEAGFFPTSYIPTTTATVTRSADVASITGTNFSSWYRQVEGTIFFDGINPAATTTGFAVSDGSNNNRIQMDSGTSTRVARVVSGGTIQAANSIAYTYGTSQRFALSYVTNSINFANAGVLGTEVTSATIPTVDQMRIGTNPTGANSLNSTVKRIVFWPQRLPNATLQQITR